MTAGFPDFTQKGASALDYLGSFPVNTSGTVPFDLTDLITPSHNGLLIIWIASLAYLGGAVYVEVDASLNIAAVVPASQVDDGGQLLAPFPGIYFTDNPGNTCTLEVSMPFGAAGPATGNLLVFGVNATPLTVPAIRKAQIGLGAVASKVVNAGATTQIIPGPPAGTYYRLKIMNYSLNVAPAAATKITFQGAASGGTIWSTSVAVAASQHDAIAVDLEWDEGVAVNNTTSLNVPCFIGYEIWPV